MDTQRPVDLSRQMDVVTGAFGYTGRHIARRLLEMGRTVKTLTGHPARFDPFDGRVAAEPLDFSQPDRLRESLRGAATLYNTYWIRFPHGATTFDTAVANSRVLLKAAVEAGVRRVVHISITGANSASPLPYFRGKGLVEEELTGQGVSYGIVRPTIVFGDEDILLNNIAWALRRFPMFPLPGRGQYRVQPVYVGDLAKIAVRAGMEEANVVRDGAGPETLTFAQMVQAIRSTVGSRTVTIPVPPYLALALSSAIGLLVRDVVLTKDEIRGLMAGLLVSRDPPTGTVALSDWLQQNKATLGRRYRSELSRHYR